MQKQFVVFIVVLIFSSITVSPSQENQQVSSYDWAVIGAGFAGITALAVLLESGIKASTIVWIDPEFNVGRVGKCYGNVPGNIQVQSILYYVSNCPFLKNIGSSAIEKLYEYKLDDYPLLQVIIDPLQDFTDYLRKNVPSIKDSVSEIVRSGNYWRLPLSGAVIKAKKVILAIGAQPKRLNYVCPEIPLDDALDKDKLTEYISQDDVIAVFGSMHSAMLILKYLAGYSVKQIINFYLHDYFFGAPGLEGETALWVKNTLEKGLVTNLIRVQNISENRDKWLNICTKAIYAIGYEQTKISINGSYEIHFDENTGKIDENLYGIGIAFPATGFYNGHKIAKNGLNAYLAYAKKLIPHWVNQDKACISGNAEIPWI